MTIAIPPLARVPVDQRGITIGDFLVPIRLGERISPLLRHVVLVVFGALLIALTANVSVPVPGSPVPVTGQTFAVLLVGGALGFRRGIAATLLYVVLGLFLPVYAEHRSGVATIASWDGHLVLGATGGYLVGFIVASAMVGRLAELGWDRRLGGAIAAMAIGNILIYVVGVPWLMAATGNDLSWGIAHGVTPFLVGDALKLALAAGAFPIAWWLVGRRPGER